MKYQKMFFLPALLFLTTCLSAQRNFLKGSVVSLNGDTLKGFIDYRNWERNPEQISFKSVESSSDQIYTVNDIKAFEITGHDQYLKAIVVKDMLPVTLNKLEYEGVQKLVNDTVFLRTIVNGDKISLYELIDDKPHYYIQQADGDFEELIYKIYLRKEDRTVSIKREIYKDQLKRFIPEDVSMRKRIDNAAYDEKDLGLIVSKLNGKNSTDQKSAESSTPKSRFLAGAGVSMNKINFSGSKTELTVLNENYTPGFSVGAGVDVLSKRDLQSFFFRFMISYHTMTYEGEAITDGPLTYQKQKKQYDLKMNMINPGVYFFYTVWRNKVGKLHIGLGAGYNITTYSENTYTTTNQNTGDVSQRENYLDLGNWLDIHGKLGYVIKDKFEIELDTRIAGSFVEYEGVGSRARSYMLSLHRYF